MSIKLNQNLDDTEQLLNILPAEIFTKIFDKERLTEIVIDIDRPVELRYDDGQFLELDLVGNTQTINDILTKISEPGIDNRCGLNGTLHRISVIRSRTKKIVGMTIRVGKPYVGNAKLILDLLQDGKSILLVGAPAVGKTSLLREASRILSVDILKRVVIVDTSNEIAGEGEVPHQAVGRSRRLQVPLDREQHEVMIESVENHNPQVVIVDEISTQEESSSIQTIAQRGVQIMATAHGDTLMDIILNRKLSEIVGGIKTVTLSDDTAALKNSPKTVQERETTPPFDCVVEIHAFDEVGIHHDATQAIDAILSKKKVQPEIRRLINDEPVVLIPGKISEATPPTDAQTPITSTREYRISKFSRRIDEYEPKGSNRPKRRR